MIPSKRYEILDSLPSYGPMHISISSNGQQYYSEGFAVRFYKSDGSDWVANFETGQTAFNAVYEFGDLENVLVIAGGICYLMNPNDRIPVSTFGWGFESAFKTVEGGLVLQDCINIAIVKPDGNLDHKIRVSIDGIKDVKLDGDFVKGFARSLEDDWMEFILNLKTGNLTGGSNL
jgi:hypothetical protein